MRTDNGQVIRLKDYKIADYKITHVDLLFKLDPGATIVRARLSLERTKGVRASTPLRLDGEELKLNWVKVNGEKLNQDDYLTTDQHLEITHPPATKNFTVETEVEINPDTCWSNSLYLNWFAWHSFIHHIRCPLFRYRIPQKYVNV